jgi:hypothetical protein
VVVVTTPVMVTSSNDVPIQLEAPLLKSHICVPVKSPKSVLGGTKSVVVNGPSVTVVWLTTEQVKTPVA